MIVQPIQLIEVSFLELIVKLMILIFPIHYNQQQTKVYLNLLWE